MKRKFVVLDPMKSHRSTVMSRVCVILLLVCGVVPALAQEQANEIRCSGGGATCKTGFVPKFGSNGGSATVNDSIMAQDTASDIKITGTETVTGQISSGSNISATGGINAGGGVTTTNVNASGSVSGNSGDFLNGLIVGGQVFAGSGQFTGNLNAGGTVSGFAASFTGNITAGGNITTGGFGSFGNISGLNISGVQGSFNAGGATALILNNNASSQTLSVTNHATPSNSNFTEAQFNNTQATFFTDTLGDTTAIGVKHAAVPMQNGQMVDVSSMESPEVWFEDFGSGQLTGGITTVSLDASFSQIVNTLNGYRVFLTPTGDCKGLYVMQKTPGSFEVRELGGGQSNVEFDYRIVAHRNGYETTRLPVAKMPKPVAQNRAPHGK
jgi:hypothetical protein